MDLEAIRDFCLANGERATYAKGESFTEEGSVGRYVAIVKSGYFKYCVLKENGDYAVTGFTFAGECLMDFTQSFVFGKPSMMSILAGCDAEVVQVPMKILRDHLAGTKPQLIAQMSAVLLEEAYRRYLRLYKLSPTERYLELIEEYPEVLEKVTLRDIASYLLITPIHLSRIRNRVGKLFPNSQYSGSWRRN